MKERTKRVIEAIKEEDALDGAFLALAILCHEEKDKGHVAQGTYAFFMSLARSDRRTATAVSIGMDRALSELIEEDENDGKDD